MRWLSRQSTFKVGKRKTENVRWFSIRIFLFVKLGIGSGAYPLHPARGEGAGESESLPVLYTASGPRALPWPDGTRNPVMGPETQGGAFSGAGALFVGAREASSGLLWGFAGLFAVLVGICGCVRCWS